MSDELFLATVGAAFALTITSHILTRRIAGPGGTLARFSRLASLLVTAGVGLIALSFLSHQVADGGSPSWATVSVILGGVIALIGGLLLALSSAVAAYTIDMKLRAQQWGNLMSVLLGVATVVLKLALRIFDVLIAITAQGDDNNLVSAPLAQNAFQMDPDDAGSLWVISGPHGTELSLGPSTSAVKHW